MVDATERLRKLSEKASKLNKSSDEINEFIAAYEAKLAGMKLGVEVWVQDPEHHTFHSYLNVYSNGPVSESFCLRVEERNMEKDEGGNAKNRQALIHVLGYCKINGVWRIAAKRGWATTTGEKYPGLVTSWEEIGDRYPLIEGSRDARIKALGAMDALFMAIEEKVNEMLGSLEAGKKFLKSIE